MIQTRLCKAGCSVAAAVAMLSQGSLLRAQSTAANADWETLIRVPLTEGLKPTYSIFRVSLPPAPETQPGPGAGHTHEGPVFVYVVKGTMESQIDPDPPRTYSAGEFFSETPGRIHRMLRNYSKTEPAGVLTFQTGYTGTATPSVRESLAKVADQEVSLLRLILPAGTSANIPPNTNNDAVAVIDGTIDTDQRVGHRAGDIFVRQAGSRLVVTATGNTPARLLLYHVTAKPEQKK